MSELPQLHPHIPPGRFELAELLEYEPPTRWRPEENEQVKGVLVKQEDRRAFGQEAPTLFVLVPPETNNPRTERYLTVRASGVVLRGALEELRPRPGEQIALKYEGMHPTVDGQRQYHLYRVAVRRDGRWVVAA